MLNEEQRAVVDLPTDARAFVVAAPGTGKTHVLVHRVAELVQRDVGASEVLVLSFTNAVVGELRRRLGSHEETEAAYVRPVTIDSFAGRIVARSGADPMEFGHDDTIRKATALVTESADQGGLTRTRHVIVDEAQDLVGERLDFVAAILEVSASGFTVLGDPAQGIYGFTAGDGTTNGIDALKASFPSAVVMTLTQDHRSLRADAAPGQALRGLITGSEPAAACAALVRRLHDCDRLTVDQLPTVLRRADSSTGVLCRTNGEALFLAGLMADAGVTHSVRRGASATVPPAWVARVLGDMTSTTLSREQFTTLAKSSEEWTEGAWRAMRRIAGARSGSVDVRILRERIAGLKAEEAPDDLSLAPVLSTVHRSKGLEYDTVILLEPYSDALDNEPADEGRVLYVAMTRARRRTTRLERPEMPGRLVRRRGRWALLPWSGRGLSRIELRPGDVATMLDDELGGDDIRAQQDQLRDEVRPGDPVVLTRLDSRRAYAVEHRGRRIGMTGETFASFSDDLPVRIEDVRIDCLRTAAADPARTMNLGIGGGGFWIVPELVGLGRLTWEDASR